MSYDLAVVIPTYNRASMLKRAIESVPLSVEVVVVDDASSDSTNAVLETFGDRVRHMRLESNGGPCAARNAGIALATAERLLFLDDDDVMLPRGADLIRAACLERPDVPLHMFNCEWSDGLTSIPVDTPPTIIDYRRWLGGEFDVELKPVARRDLFGERQFEDTGASGEGLLWGQVIRDRQAVAVGCPVILYNVAHSDRLTSVSGLLQRSEHNAAIADRWLELFGEDQRLYAPAAWSRRVMAAAFYHAVSRQRAEVGRLLLTNGLPARQRAAIALIAAMPSCALRALFRVRARRTTRRGVADQPLARPARQGARFR